MRTLTRLHQVIVTVIALTVLAPGHAETIQLAQSGAVGKLVTEEKDRIETLIQKIIEPDDSTDISEIPDEPVFSKEDLNCLARNIYYEAANEPKEGKVAVGMVTLNRVLDNRFPKSICGVVHQKTVLSIPKQIKIRTNRLSKSNATFRTATIWKKLTVCQFSWACMFVPKPRNDERWEQSQEVARGLLEGDYDNYREKYSDAMYFHAVSIRPKWAQKKRRVAKMGGHVFYSEKL